MEALIRGAAFEKLGGFMGRCGEAVAKYDRGAQPAVPSN
jgi:hypothetical protein